MLVGPVTWHFAVPLGCPSHLAVWFPMIQSYVAGSGVISSQVTISERMNSSVISHIIPETKSILDDIKSNDPYSQ